LSLNTISLLLVSFTLVCHVVWLGIDWFVIRKVSVTTVLFIFSQSFLIVGLLSDHDVWTTWIAAVLLILIAFRLPKRLSSMRDQFAASGISEAGSEERLQTWEEGGQRYATKLVRERQFEARRKAWWAAFAVEARPKEISFEIELPESIQLKTTEEIPLTLRSGKGHISLGGWEKFPVGDKNHVIKLRVWVTDSAGVVWTSDYSVDIEDLVEIGFSDTPKRKPEELWGWTEINPEIENAFRENCLIAKAHYHTDMRNWIEAAIGRHDYLVVTKYQRGVIDLAWVPESNRLLLRLAGLRFSKRDGLTEFDFEAADWSPGPDDPPWKPWEIEPVVFPIFPEELLPFGSKTVGPAFRYTFESESWPPTFSRLSAPAE